MYQELGVIPLHHYGCLRLGQEQRTPNIRFGCRGLGREAREVPRAEKGFD